MTRKNIVGIIHEFLREELQEPDEIDAAPAYVLQDLFDCRVCAGHIIQIYVKGIMDGITMPDGRIIFDAEKTVSERELAEVLTRVCFREFRTPRRSEAVKSSPVPEPEEVSPEQVSRLLREEKNVLLVDVRTEREYAEEHLQGAVNVPVLSVIKNPFLFSGYYGKKILLYCGEGYQSKAAAQCLLEAGYKNVAFFARKEEKQ